MAAFYPSASRMEMFCALNKLAQVSSLADCSKWPDDIARMSRLPDHNRSGPRDCDVATRPRPVAPEGSEERAQLPENPREIGGRGGLEPTRYGDWEKNGRCIDF